MIKNSKNLPCNFEIFELLCFYMCYRNLLISSTKKKKKKLKIQRRDFELKSKAAVYIFKVYTLLEILFFLCECNFFILLFPMLSTT